MLWITLLPLMLMGLAVAVVPLVIGLNAEHRRQALTVPAPVTQAPAVGEEALPLAA
ncbi:MAG TPA: hypothetical protein VK277_08900 [Acidimicrobiales bacterium]|nr:hypothetical protein [Acidimicrobiales bacterium]